ncbi:MAG: hypothetical protein RIQ53_164 [Pseudomonadota bacterium]|jgi:hypothetical protein
MSALTGDWLTSTTIQIYIVDLVNQYAQMKNPQTPTARRWRRYLPLLIVPPVICSILSGVLTWLVAPDAPDFGARWARNFLSALPVLPVGMIVMGQMNRVLAPVLGPRSPLLLKLTLALVTALVMETLIGGIVVIGQHGLSTDLPGQVAHAALRALPVGLGIALLMAFVIRPRLQRWQERLA